MIGAAPMSAAQPIISMESSSSSAASHMSVFLGSPPDSPPPHRPTPALAAAKLPQQPGCGRPVTSRSSSGGSSGGSSGSGGSSDSGGSRGVRRHAAAAGSSAAPAKPKPTGYRKLWALVSSVERGQRVAQHPKREDVTVEDLIKAVSQLRPTDSALDAIAPGLAFMDSRATAALLKGLAKAGMPLRAVEIFDHLRSLPASDELSALVDVYTYTTSISQCNSHHQLRRALELVAEMRGRDVPLNVHTYSALLNVCLKANELELAQDVHARMLAEGVAPNLVTHNTLLDIYHKAGLWRQALGVLDLLQHQNIRPEARTHNTIIATCNAAGRFTEAVRVYETMVASGVEPNGASYNAALTSYARSGGDQLDTTLSLFAAMGARGYERGANTYAAVLAATETPGRWDVALKLLQQMQGEGVRPSSACLTSAMTACLHGGEPLRAEQLFNRLCGGVCKPDAATFSTLLIVFTSLGKVQEATNMLEIMLRSGQHIEPATLAAVIDAAWGTGVVPLQQYAQQLLERGRQQGLFTLTVTQQVCSEGCVLALQLPGGPAHVVQLSLLGLLAQLREQAGTLLSPLIEGSGCAKVLLRLPVQGQDASALRHLTTTQLSSLASPFVSIPPLLPSDATSAVGGASSPTVPDNASAAPELHFVAEAAAVGEWLQSPAVLLALGQLVVPAGGFPPVAGLCAGGRGGVDGLVVSADDGAREAKCRQAMASVSAFDSLAASAQAIPPAMLPQRCELAAMLLQHAALLGLPSEIGHDAVQLLDRVLASASLAALAASVSPPLLAAACLTIAARHDPTAAAADTASLCGAQPQQVALVAAQVQQLLGRGCIAISAMRVLQLMLERLGVSRADGAAAMAVCGQAAALLTHAAASPAFVGCVPSVMAASVLYASRLAAGLLPAWPGALAGLTGFPETDAALQPAIQAAMQLLVEL